MDQSNANSLDDRITEEAASWFLRIQEGFSQSDFRDWRQWLAESDTHAEAFDGVTKFWQAANQLNDLPWPSDRLLANDTYDGHIALTLPANSNGCERSGQRSRRFWLAAAASIAVASLIGLILVQELNQDVRSYQTVTAEHRTISLQDGSVITLGAESDVVVTYGKNSRHVELRSGEAYFKVAKDSNRAFVVAARSRTVRALGTEFGINIGVRDIKVSVVEGRVRIEGPLTVRDDSSSDRGTPTISNLSTGDVLDFNAAGSVEIVSEVDPILTTSWLDGRLAYDGTTLESVIADVNRYSKTKLIIGDDATKRLIFTGTIFSDDVDDWLDGLEKVFPLRLIQVDGHGILLIQSKR